MEYLKSHRDRRKRHFHLLALACCASILSVSGCGQQEETTLVFTPVEGVVTLDGTPISNANIVFHPQFEQPGFDGAASQSDERGRYRLKSSNSAGALPGSYKVTVKAATDASDGSPTIPEKNTDKQTTDIQIEVRTDRAIGYNIELSASE